MRLRILSFLALSLLLSGCDSINHNNVTPVVGTKDSPLWSQPNQEEVTLSWYINYAWFTTKWGHNKISQKITEDTGISIDFIVPSGSENTALDALILADDLPDLITLGWWEPQIDYMIDNNMVHAINTLADTHDPYFWKVGDPDTLGWYTKDDGNVYAYPNSSFTPSDYDNYENIPSNQTFLVRKDIYEAIGSPDMSTQEGFKSAIKKALEMFPEVNGEPLIPFGAHEFTEKGNDSFDTFLMNFLAIPYEKEGTFYDRFSDPEYVSWLKLFREMYEEGLLSNDVFFDKRTQVSEKVAEGRYFAMLYQYTDLKDQQKLLYSQDPDSIYYAIDGPKNENKDDHVLTGNSVNGWTVTLISKKSKYPERAMALMTYMISEYGQKITSIGIKDDMYDVIEGKPVVKAEIMDILKTNRNEYDAIYGSDNAYWMFQDLAMQSKWLQDPQPPIAQLESWTYPYVQYRGQYDIRFPSGSPEALIYTHMTDLWSETLPKLITAKSEQEFDQLFAHYLTQRDLLGFDTYMEAATMQMQLNKERLGLK